MKKKRKSLKRYLREVSKFGVRSLESLKVILVIIDPQNDYGQGGSLHIPEAAEASLRIAEFIRDHLDTIDEIFVTLESRYQYHITSSIFWKDIDGNPPPPYTVIEASDILMLPEDEPDDEIGTEGKWLPADPSMKQWCIYYTKQLKRKDKFPLTIWPDHCVVSYGHIHWISFN